MGPRVVGDAGHGAGLLADGVGVGARGGKIDLGERDAAVGAVLRGRRDLAVSVDELEGELAGLEVAALESLGRTDLEAALCPVGVGERRGLAAGVGDRAGERAVAVVGRLDGQVMGLRVVAHAGHGAGLLADGIAVLARGVKPDLGERDAAVGLVLGGGDNLAVSVDELELKLALLQLAAVEDLGGLGLEAALCPVGVGERRGRAAVVGDLALEGAVAVVGGRDRQVVGLRVVAHAGHGAGLLADGVAVLARGGQPDLVERDLAVGAVLRGGDDLAERTVGLDLHELELELAGLEVAALEDLGRTGPEGALCPVPVGERRGGASVVGDGAVELSVVPLGHARIHRETVRLPVIGYAAGVALDLTDAVAARTLTRQLDGRELDLAVGAVLRGGDDLAERTVGLDLHELELELAGLQLAALEDLARLDPERALGRRVLVGERRGRSALVGDHTLERAVAVIRRLDSQAARRGVVCNTAPGTLDLADAVAALASTLQLDLAERDLAVGIVLRGGNHVAVGIVSLDLDELELELAILELPPLERLGRLDLEGALGRLDIVRKRRHNVVGRNVDHLAAEIAIRVVGCHHVQDVLGLVVNDGSVLARLLADAVLIAALGVDTQLAEHHVTLSVILRGGDDLAVGPVGLDLHELELELVLLELAALERLVGAGHEGPRLLEHVDEPGLGAALVGDLAFQFPVTGVRRRNCQVARRGVVGHAGLGAGDLAHAVAMLAQRGHGHFAERHVTLSVILRGGDDLAVGTVGLHLKQLKRVGILLEARALHVLGRMGGKRALRLIAIGEHGRLRSGAGADVGNRALELAVIGLGRTRSHRQVVCALVIGDAGRRSGLLADAVAVLAGRGHGDARERHIAASVVLCRRDDIAVGAVGLHLEQIEGELVVRGELAAVELLNRLRGKAALRSLIRVGERRGGAALVGDGAGERAVAVVGRLDGQAVLISVVGHAGLVAPGLADAVAVGARGGHGHVGERHVAVAVISGRRNRLVGRAVRPDLNELEGELAGLELTALELLLSAHGKAALGLHGVGVGDARHDLTISLDRARHCAARLVARGDVELGDGVAQTRLQVLPGLGLAGREGELLALARGVPVNAELEALAGIALRRALDLLDEGERAVARLNGLRLVGEHGQRGLAVVGDVRAQGTVAGSLDLHRHIDFLVVIRHAVMAAYHLADGVAILAHLVIGDRAEVHRAASTVSDRQAAARSTFGHGSPALRGKREAEGVACGRLAVERLKRGDRRVRRFLVIRDRVCEHRGLHARRIDSPRRIGRSHKLVARGRLLVHVVARARRQAVDYAGLVRTQSDVKRAVLDIDVVVNGLPLRGEGRRAAPVADAALDHVARLIGLGRVDAQFVASDLPTRKFIVQRVEHALWESEGIALIGCCGDHFSSGVIGVRSIVHGIRKINPHTAPSAGVSDTVGKL